MQRNKKGLIYHGIGTVEERAGDVQAERAVLRLIADFSTPSLRASSYWSEGLASNSIYDVSVGWVHARPRRASGGRIKTST